MRSIGPLGPLSCFTCPLCPLFVGPSASHAAMVSLKPVSTKNVSRGRSQPAKLGEANKSNIQPLDHKGFGTLELGLLGFVESRVMV